MSPAGMSQEAANRMLENLYMEVSYISLHTSDGTELMRQEIPLRYLKPGSSITFTMAETVQITHCGFAFDDEGFPELQRVEVTPEKDEETKP